MKDGGFSYQHCYEEETYDEDQYMTGATIYLIAKIWDNAYDADHNTKLKQGLDLVNHRFVQLIVTVSFS